MTEGQPRDAISEILKVLEPLDELAREKVLAAVHAYFQSTAPPIPGRSVQFLPELSTAEPTPAVVPKDILGLKKEKQPRSDIEMVALVAYYLSEKATDSEKKDAICVDDLKKYFKQAGHRLPKDPGQTLRNARNAGYLESRGEGQFKLNPVGYNLVVHSLPKSASDSGPTRKRRKKATVKKKRTSKK